MGLPAAGQHVDIPGGELCSEGAPCSVHPQGGHLPPSCHVCSPFHPAEAFLKGGSAFPPPLQPQSCRAWSLAQRLFFKGEEKGLK